MIRILVAEDHHLVRAGICSLLRNIAGAEVVAEAANGREALEMIRTQHPDIVLMDIAMPELNGLEATRRVTREFPGIRVIILSMHTSEEYVMQALHVGASGYLLKTAEAAELELAVRAVAKGEVYLSPPVSKHVVAEYLQRTTAVRPADVLTSRHREILQLIAEGHSTKEIAAKLNISVKTVESHRAQLMERLKIHDVPGLVRYAIRIGLIESD
jgi:DNA-binding NarL/FixJ family response regulator